MSGRAACRSGTAGFTLIELVVVLTVLAVATVVVLPTVGRGTESVQLRSQAGRVAAVLREARLQAVTHRRPARVSLDRARNTVTLTTGDPDRPVRELAVPAGIRVTVAVGGDSLTFTPRGTARETRWLVAAAGDRRLAIDVDAVTGRVTVGREDRERREGRS